MKYEVLLALAAPLVAASLTTPAARARLGDCR